MNRFTTEPRPSGSAGVDDNAQMPFTGCWRALRVTDVLLQCLVQSPGKGGEVLEDVPFLMLIVHLVGDLL